MLMAMHWPEDARNDAGISTFDYEPLSRSIMSERGITGNFHKLFGYALVLAENRQPIMAIGRR